jgi:hypothetical protein
MRARPGATGAKAFRLTPKELGNCRARGWSGLGLVGRHSRTKHGQLINAGSSCLPRRPAETSISGPPDRPLAKDRHSCMSTLPQLSWRHRPRLGLRSLSTGMRQQALEVSVGGTRPGWLERIGNQGELERRTSFSMGQGFLGRPMAAGRLIWDHQPKTRRRGVGIEYCVPECPIAAILENFRRYAAGVRPTLRLNSRRKKVGSS